MINKVLSSFSVEQYASLFDLGAFPDGDCSLLGGDGVLLCEPVRGPADEFRAILGKQYCDIVDEIARYPPFTVDRDSSGIASIGCNCDDCQRYLLQKEMKAQERRGAVALAGSKIIGGGGFGFLPADEDAASDDEALFPSRGSGVGACEEVVAEDSPPSLLLPGSVLRPIRLFSSLVSAFRHMRYQKQAAADAAIAALFDRPPPRDCSETVKSCKPKPKLDADAKGKQQKTKGPDDLNLVSVKGVTWWNTGSGAASRFGGCFRVQVIVRNSAGAKVPVSRTVFLEDHADDIDLAFAAAVALRDRIKADPRPFLENRIQRKVKKQPTPIKQPAGRAPGAALPVFKSSAKASASSGVSARSFRKSGSRLLRYEGCREHFAEQRHCGAGRRRLCDYCLHHHLLRCVMC
ncbi:unnamed protein product [Amoebophrya sp. A120]|nr:unnamed protein product [Amoebophrya sp. A120]|eukprot:GSA120T00020407001.1